VISQEVVSSQGVSFFCERVVFGYTNGIGVVAQEGNSPKYHFKVPHGAHNPWDLGLAATYSAPMVDYATEDCFQEDQQTREDLRKWQVPEVLFWSTPHPTKSASEKPTRSS
jgi:hypothetical protein